MKNHSLLSKAQPMALINLSALIGAEEVSHIVAQGPDVLNARLDAI